MKFVRALLIAALVPIATIAGPGKDANAQHAASAFPQAVRVRFWYLHPPHELRVAASNAQAEIRTCAACKPSAVSTQTLTASGSSVNAAGLKSSTPEVHLSGAYQLTAADLPPIHADFPADIRADAGHLLITAEIPMEEYIAGVLAGETGNFKSDEALKAMAVAARTYAMHFGSRHAVDGFDFCDTTHCQNLRFDNPNPHLREIAEATAGEVLWYEGEPAATYYFANCGGTTEDGRYILGNNEEPAPYLKQHSDQYCVRNGEADWRSEVTKRELQHALEDDGINVPGTLKSVSVLHRTDSGRVELVRVSGRGTMTVPGVAFRAAIGRHIGWDRLKSNLYDVSDRGDRIVFHGRGLGHGVGLCQIGAEVMGEEGRTYRQILAFYYPGTKLGVGAQGFAWQQLANDDVELLTSHPEHDRSLLPLATRSLHAAEESTGLMYREKPRLKVYATVADFRNATGEPGWIAASTRGRTIQLQPPDVLRQAGTLDNTIYHELLHMLVDEYAHSGTPLWFREGLVLYLSEPDAGNIRNPHPADFDGAAIEKSLRAPQREQELRAAYAQAQARVAQLAEAHGKETLIEWLQNGLAPEVKTAAQR